MDHGPAVPPTSDTIALRHSWTRSSDTGADGTKGLVAHTKLPTSATDPKYRNFFIVEKFVYPFYSELYLGRTLK